MKLYRGGVLQKLVHVGVHARGKNREHVIQLSPIKASEKNPLILPGCSDNLRKT